MLKQLLFLLSINFLRTISTNNRSGSPTSRPIGTKNRSTSSTSHPTIVTPNQKQPAFIGEETSKPRTRKSSSITAFFSPSRRRSPGRRKTSFALRTPAKTEVTETQDFTTQHLTISTNNQLTTSFVTKNQSSSETSSEKSLINESQLLIAPNLAVPSTTISNQPKHYRLKEISPHRQQESITQFYNSTNSDCYTDISLLKTKITESQDLQEDTVKKTLKDKANIENTLQINQELNKENQALSNENQTLKMQMQDLKMQMQDLRNRNGSFATEKNTLQSHISDIQKNNENLNQDIKMLRQDIQQKQERIENLKQKNNELKLRYKELEEQYKNLQQINNQFELMKKYLIQNGQKLRNRNQNLEQLLKQEQLEKQMLQQQLNNQIQNNMLLQSSLMQIQMNQQTSTSATQHCQSNKSKLPQDLRASTVNPKRTLSSCQVLPKISHT